jgi:hypothetical protein
MAFVHDSFGGELTGTEFSYDTTRFASHDEGQHSLVVEMTTISELFANKDETFLVKGILLHRDESRSTQNVRIIIPFLILDFGFEAIDGVGGFDCQGDGIFDEGLDKDLHIIRRANR